MAGSGNWVDIGAIEDFAYSNMTSWAGPNSAADDARESST
jgi:hypothetical protein